MWKVLYRGIVYDDLRNQNWNLSIYLNKGKRCYLTCVCSDESGNYYPAHFEMDGSLIEFNTKMDKSLVRATQKVLLKNEYIFERAIKNMT